MTTTRATPFLHAACASLLLATTLAAHAAPMTIPAMKQRVASLLSGTFPAKDCNGIQVDQAPTGTLVISTDGRVVGPQIDVSLFDPAGETGFERRLENGVTTVHVSVYANGKSFSLERAVPSDTPGFIEEGVGEPNANVTSGAECHTVDFSTARIAAPTFDLASDVAPMFVTTQAIKGMCRSMAHGHARDKPRPSQFVLDVHGVLVDGVPLPFASAKQPVVATDVGSRFKDGTLNGSFTWADGSSFHVERYFESEGVSTFGFTIAGKPDADKMFCQPAR